MTIDIDNLNLQQFNETTLNNLLTQLNRIYSTNNLLILDPVLSPWLNFLTPFQNIKDSSNCQNVIWFNDELLNVPKDIIVGYTSLIVLMPESKRNLDLFHQFQLRFPEIRINLIIKNLTKHYLLQLNNELSGIVEFEKLIKNELSNININSKVKVFNWKTAPIYIDDILICDIGEYHGVDEFFQSSIKQVDQLSSLIIELLFKNIKPDNHQHSFKLRNVYGKGNDASLLIEQVLKFKLPQYFSRNFSELETEFYKTQFKGNCDLVVLERNIDYFPVLFNQLNYNGIIDDLFDVNFDKITKFDSEAYSKLSNDDLYNQDLKHLNFANIGSRLNKLAKVIQQQFKSSNPNDTNLSEMKQLVSNLGNLSLQQDLIKKHTSIGESILKIVNHTQQFDTFLNFENDIFEMDYKLQLSKLKFFFNNNYNINQIWSTIILISLINDGIQAKDVEWISKEIHINYGFKSGLKLEKLIQHKLIRVNQESNTNDFLSSLGLVQRKQTPQPVTDEDNSIGVSGGKDIYKSNYTLINKFWNLHPLDEEEDNTIKDDNSTSLINLYTNPSFTLPGNTVPLIYRLVESLYFRDFLKYKPVYNLQKRPNWENLGLNTMFSGKTIDLNLNQINDNKSKFIIIVIIGGITRSEITCFKYLQDKFVKQGQNKQIILVSNNIINNNKFCKFINS